MIIFNIERKTHTELMGDIYTSMVEEKGREIAHVFRNAARHTKNKPQLLTLARDFMHVETRDSVENCLYCEDLLMIQGLFCDDICEELYKEDETCAG